MMASPHPARSRFLLATAFSDRLSGYNLSTFRHDLIAGFVVSLLALPLAMALSIAVGLPPQHGIYTAIAAGIITPLLGGSIMQVSGPTAAFVVIVAPIVAEHGLHGLIWCELIAGILLIAMGMARLGRYVHFIPYPVTTGFTAGIAVVIATLSLNDFLGLGIKSLSGTYLEKASAIVEHLPSLNPYECAVGMVTLLAIIGFGRISRKLPAAIVGMAAGTLLAWLFQENGHTIATIGSRFTYTLLGGGVGHGIPPYPPEIKLPHGMDSFLLSFAELRTLLVPAMVVAALAALESLLSATVADGMANTRHNPNAELNGIGIGNIASALVGGIPATGAIARTAVNIHSGARTPIASSIHGILILVYVLLLAPYISHIPMAALAALLLHTAYRMSHFHQFVRTIAIAPRSDTIVLLVCFTLTVFIDMVAGVTAGFILASLLFMKHISDLTQIDLADASMPPVDRRQYALPADTMIYRINGPLFFGTVEKAYDRYNFIHDHINKLIIDLERVPMVDMTGLVAMKSMLLSIAREGREVILCGRREITDKILQKLGPAAGKHVRTSRSVRDYLSPQPA